MTIFPFVSESYHPLNVYPSFVGLLAGRVEYVSPNVTVIESSTPVARVPPLSSK